MTNLIEARTQEIEELIESYEGAIEITHQSSDEDANEMTINGITYTVEIHIFEDEYRMFTSDMMETYTEDERADGKNHKTAKTMRGVKSYIRKYALDE